MDIIMSNSSSSRCKQQPFVFLDTEEDPGPIPIALGDPAIPAGLGDDNEVAAVPAGPEPFDDSEAPAEENKREANAGPEVPGRASDSDQGA